MPTAFLATVLVLLVTFTRICAQPPGTDPVKIFIHPGQSNTQGQGEVSPVGTSGSIQTVTVRAVSGKLFVQVKSLSTP